MKVMSIKKSLKGKTSSQAINGYNDSKIASNEKNDCVVRALAVLLNVSYDKAYEVAKNDFNRKKNKGVTTSQLINTKDQIIEGMVFNPLKNKMITYPGSERFIRNKNKKKTKSINIVVRDLVEKFPKGNYMVLVRKHAFALKDGEIIGNPNDLTSLKRKVLNLIEVLPAPVEVK